MTIYKKKKMMKKNSWGNEDAGIIINQKILMECMSGSVS